MWYNIIRERKVLKMRKLRKPRLSKATIKKLYNGEKVESGKYIYEYKSEWDYNLNAYVDSLYRWDENDDYEMWDLGTQGLWEFEK
mgnify:CR=1 FL=1